MYCATTTIQYNTLHSTVNSKINAKQCTLFLCLTLIFFVFFILFLKSVNLTSVASNSLFISECDHWRPHLNYPPPNDLSIYVHIVSCTLYNHSRWSMVEETKKDQFKKPVLIANVNSICSSGLNFAVTTNQKKRLIEINKSQRQW